MTEAYVAPSGFNVINEKAFVVDSQLYVWNETKSCCKEKGTLFSMRIYIYIMNITDQSRIRFCYHIYHIALMIYRCPLWRYGYIGVRTNDSAFLNFSPIDLSRFRGYPAKQLAGQHWSTCGLVPNRQYTLTLPIYTQTIDTYNRTRTTGPNPLTWFIWNIYKLLKLDVYCYTADVGIDQYNLWDILCRRVEAMQYISLRVFHVYTSFIYFHIVSVSTARKSAFI